MHLILLRHGIAADLSDLPPGPVVPPWEDALRPLTERGRRRVARAARGLECLGVRPKFVLHSPLVRARETALLVARRLGVPTRRWIETEALVPDADPRALFQEIARLPAAQILGVGHAPHLDRLVALACGTSGHLITRLGKAGSACLELRDAGRPDGRVVWLLPPKTLRRLARD